MTKTEEGRVVTGPALVIVETTDKVRDAPVAVPVRRGEPLPANIADGQIDKLEALGAFLTPEEHRESMLAGPRSSTLAEPLPQETGVTATPATEAHNTAPEGEAVTTPGIVPRDDVSDTDEDTVKTEAQVAHNTADADDSTVDEEKPAPKSRR